MHQAATSEDIVQIIDQTLGQLAPAINRLKTQHSSFRFAACGSTALAVQAAILDSRNESGWLMQSLGDYQEIRHSLDPGTAVIGISLSGHSVEVREVLNQAAADGISAIFVSLGTSIESAHNLLIGPTEIPQRFLPLLAMRFVQFCLGSAFPEKDISSQQIHPVELSVLLQEFLVKTYQAELMPVFAAPKPDIKATQLKTQYMEFLKRPAIQLIFPEWTHDFLWSLSQADKNRYALILFEPRIDLTDQRFQKCVNHIQNLGISHLVINHSPAQQVPNPNSRIFRQVLDLFQTLADQLGIDPSQERSFTSEY